MAHSVSIVKDVGFKTAVQTIHHRAKFEYGVDFNGASAHVGANEDEISIHLLNGVSDVAALAILNAVELPTCTAAVLTVTVNLGTYLVNDTTVVTDGVNKFVLACVAMDNITGVIEILIFQKDGLLAEYGIAPVGKTLITKLKEYEIVAAALVELADFIS